MLMMEDIVREGHPVLLQVAEEVKFPLSEEDRKTIRDMQEFLENSQDEEVSEKYGLRAGVGLAAPQINISKRIFAVDLLHEGKRFRHVFINPKIISHSVEQSYLGTGEGCLSVDREVPGYVLRNARITIKAFDEDGKEFKLRLRGLPAIVCQHELDHLNGIMFYDRINKDNPFEAPENAVQVGRA